MEADGVQHYRVVFENQNILEFSVDGSNRNFERYLQRKTPTVAD